MKRLALKNSLMAVFVLVSVLCLQASARADVTEVKDECAKELLLSYFPEPIVLETLKHFNVPEDKWAGIAKSLAEKDKQVVKMVEAKASAMNPNPLKDTQQRQAAVKLFRDTLYEVFSDALKENGVQDQTQFTSMLDEIQQQKAKKFAMCMEKQKAQLQRQAPGASSSTASDEDDEDSDESDDDEDHDEELDHDDEKHQEKSEEKKLISPQEKTNP